MPRNPLLVLSAAAILLVGCGDKCEVLCVNAGAKLAECKPASLSWADLGARNRNDFVTQCRQQWDRERLELTASDLRVALQTCTDTSRELADLECEDVVALYAPMD